ncbi:MAG: hypothetical protein ACKV1O_00775 [Saprospiraceae bacterium]
MPLTDHSDVFASFHEQGFNAIIQHVMLQRPSMFNYATEDLANPRYAPRLCERIKYHSAVEAYGNPLVTVVPYMPVIGYNGPYGMSYCFQLRDLVIDFHPGNIISLPPELNPPLGAQRIALSATVCAGLGCPYERFIDQLINEIKPDQSGNDRPPPPPDKPFPFENLSCFCLELNAVLRIIRNNGFVELRLDDLELIDITPNGLENALECYISTVFRLTLLPKLRIALSDLILDLSDFITLSPTPISGVVPFNPSVGNDRLSVFFNLS